MQGGLLTASKTILLTGGTGLLGSLLGLEFLRRGSRVVYLARSQRNRTARERVTALLEQLEPGYARTCPGTFDVWDGDVTQLHMGQPQAVLDAWRGKIDEVWHSAAVLHFRDTYEEINEAINVNGTVKVLDTARELGVRRFHHISTAYVSGKCPGMVLESQQTHDYDFRNPYERTKYNAEIEVRKKSAEYGFATTIYRPAVIVGDSITGRSLNFTGMYTIAKMFYMIKRLLARKLKDTPNKFRHAGIYLEGDTLVFPLRFPCSSDATLNVVPIDHVVRTMLQLGECKDAPGQTFHITNPNPPLIADLLLEGCKMFKIDGIEFVNCAFNQSLHLIREQIDKYAAMGLNIGFCFEIREYIHYFFGEPAFDLSNVRAALQSSFVEPPRITPLLIETLLGYASRQQWRDSLS